MYKCILLFFIGGLLFLNPSSQEGTLILFTNESQSVISPEEIKSIQSVAEESHIHFEKVDAKDGLPVEVKTTPSLYFQNRKGRSQYYGRYDNLSRIKNFVRTCKLAHQKDTPNIKESILVWQDGRSDITAPMKVTSLAGSVPTDYDEAQFKKDLLRDLAEGMSYYKLNDKHDVTKSTKSFYFNIYPYLNDIGELSLTAEIFSQYNCVKPIYSRLDTPLIVTPWDKRSAALNQAGAIIESEIIHNIHNSKVGDSFSTVSNDTPLVEWSDIVMLNEMEADSKAMSTPYDKSLPQQWKVEKRKHKNEPIIIFSFLSPVDNYAGEVKALSGSLTLDEIGSMENAVGSFNVNIADVTMGSEDFDYEVQNKMLKMGLFPDAQFKFVEVRGDRQPLQVGRTDDFLIQGIFTMLGIDVPIEVDAKIEPFLADKDILKLSVNCTFELPLKKKFKVEGPDGPSPAKDRLQFFMKFNLEPGN